MTFNLNIIPESHRDLVGNESRAIAYLATTMENGTPIISPVWFGIVNQYIAIFTGESTLKAKNMRARPEVTLLLQDPDNTYRYLQIFGRYIGSQAEGARDFLDAVSRRYINKDYPHNPASDGVIVLILPERSDTFIWSPD